MKNNEENQRGSCEGAGQPTNTRGLGAVSTKRVPHEPKHPVDVLCESGLSERLGIAPSPPISRGDISSESPALMRLQKFLARAGVASRRGAEGLIEAGRVQVNGTVVVQLGTKVDSCADEVRVDGARVHLPQERTTIMLHKPAGYVSTMSDPQGRPCVAKLVPAKRFPGLYPVGRLDADTTGLLLFSTDGELGHALLHPRTHVTKRYLALVEGCPSEADLARLRSGVELTDGMTLPAEASVVRQADAAHAAHVLGAGASASGVASSHGGKHSRAHRAKDGTYVRVGLREGRKRQVRRMFESVGRTVIMLRRVQFGPLQLGELKRCQWRDLTEDEIEKIRAL